MKYFRYIILLFIIVVFVVSTLSVEPFFEGTTPSYILLLRESNERMLTEFINVDSRQMAFDLSNPSEKEIFIRNNKKMIEDIGGETLFNNIFSRKGISPPCTITPPNNANITTYLSGTDVSSAYSKWETTTNGYTDLSSVFKGGNIVAQDADTAALSFVNKSANLAYDTPALFTPWSCSTGCTLSYSKTIPTELITTATDRMSSQLNSDINTYNTRKVTTNGNTAICQGGTYYNMIGGGTTCTDYEFPKSRVDSLQTNIVTYIKSYLKEPNQQLINPGFSCVSPTVAYTPTYLSTTQKVPTTDTTAQPNTYYNGILLGRTDGLKFKVIANEVGQEHVSKLKMLQSK